MSNKQFIVIGLGTFGSAVARQLRKNGCRVTGVDVSPQRIEDMQDELHEAVIADGTDREALEQLPLKNVDAVFVALGERYERSILATLHLKELGVRRILAKGVTSEHGRILKIMGVTQVIFPEEQAGVYWADKETWPNVIDFLPIDPDYSLVEIAVPQSLAGKSLLEADLRRVYGVSIIGVKDVMRDQLTLIPAGDFRMNDEQLLLVIGRKADLEQFRELK